MCRRPLASGHHYGQVPNRRRALMIRIYAAYTLCPPTPIFFTLYGGNWTSPLYRFHGPDNQPARRVERHGWRFTVTVSTPDSGSPLVFCVLWRYKHEGKQADGAYIRQLSHFSSSEHKLLSFFFHLTYIL